MTILGATTAGIGGPLLGLASASANSLNLQGSHTFMCRVRHTTTATNYDSVILGLQDGAQAIGSGDGSFITRANGGGATALEFYRFNGTFTFNTATPTGVYGDTTTWHHLCFVYDAPATDIIPYVNGVPQTAANSATTLVGSTTNLRIFVAQHPGAICDVAYFSRRLTTEEIARCAAVRNAPGMIPDLFAWYPAIQDTLAECQKDCSGKGNHLTLLQSGASNPTRGSDGVPATWGITSSRIWVPLGSIVDADGDGRTIYNASGVATSAVAKTGDGRIIYNASGQATSAVAKAGDGRTIFNASGAPTAAVAKSGDGRTVYDGSGAQTAAVAKTGDGRTIFNAAGTPTAAVAASAAGQTVYNASGTATATTIVPATGDGRTTYNGQGTATVAIATTGDGRTRYNGAGAQTAAVAAAGDGRTVYNGAGILGAAGTGATTYNGIGTATIAIAATGDGRTLYNGSGTASTAGGGGGGAAYLQNASVASNRRHSVTYGTRRKVR